MKFARSALVFSYGLFTIAAQALLFREFITTFEGSDISVGVFFGSWFLWVGLGALLVYRAEFFAEKLLKNIEFLFLCYLPAFIAELILIIQAREIAGVAPYTLLPVKTIVLLSIVVNAPVSIITECCSRLPADGFKKRMNLPYRACIFSKRREVFSGVWGLPCCWEPE
jgi:hypothetical protein